MPTRRRLLGALAGPVPLAGCSLGPRQYGNVQVGNRTGRELWLGLLCRSEGGPLSAPETVHDDSYRQPPTTSHRSTITDVVPPGSYRVRVSLAADRDADPVEHATRWTHDGAPGRSLLVLVDATSRVEFLTQ